MVMPTKKTPEMVEEILARYARGEFLKDICTGTGKYPDPSAVWRWRRDDKEFDQQYYQAMINNIQHMLEYSETFLANAVKRDEVLKGDKLLNHYRWKAERLIPELKKQLDSSKVEVSGAIGSYTVRCANDMDDVKSDPSQANEPDKQTKKLAKDNVKNGAKIVDTKHHPRTRT